MNHVGHGFSMLSVKGSVDLVKEVERCRIALLNGKNHSLKNQISLDQIASNIASNCNKTRLKVKTAVDIFKMKIKTMSICFFKMGFKNGVHDSNDSKMIQNF